VAGLRRRCVHDLDASAGVVSLMTRAGYRAAAHAIDAGGPARRGQVHPWARARPWPGVSDDLPQAPLGGVTDDGIFHRADIYQAAGMIMAQLNGTIEPDV
jgi:hypothetical protein